MRIQRFPGKRKLTVLVAAIGFALTVIPSLHLYWHSVEHNEVCNTETVCLMCIVFSSTILMIFISIPFNFLPTLHLPFVLGPFSNRNLRLEASIPTRAPPMDGLN